MKHAHLIIAAALAIAAPIAARAQGTASAKSGSTATQAQLQKEAKVKLSDATATALKEVPGGTVSKHSLASKKGKVVYAFTITVAGKSGTEKVDVDATTGEMLSHTHKAVASTKAKPPAAE